MLDTFYNEGVYQVDSAHERIKAGKLEKLKGNTCLSDLDRDYALFSHGLYFSEGHMLVDPLHDFQHVEKDSIVRIDLPAPVFNGMGGGYDVILYGCVREAWPGLSLFLHSVSGHNTILNRFWVGLTQEVPLLDFLSPEPDKLVPITVFGVSATDGIWACEPANNTKDFRLKVCKYPPEDSVLNLFKALM